MEIILINSKKGLGKIGDIVRVKDGYARNYLIPNNIALCATAADKERFQHMRNKLLADNQRAWEQASALAERLQGFMMPIIRQLGNNNKLYGSVTVRDVAAGLAEHGYNIDKSNIMIRNAVKFAGVHPVSLSLHYDVAVKIYIAVARSESEAKELFERFLSSSADKTQ